MERKIGEIFEYNGEWYQCVVAIQGCRECFFRTLDYCTRHSECFSVIRSDRTSVIFKKLEKAGEPYDFQKRTFQTYKLHTIPFLSEGVELVAIPSTDNNTIEIEIKQNKEDMEENNNAKHSNSEKIGKNLKPFDLQKAREGKPVCTRDGRKARIICFDRENEQPIVALIEKNEEESIDTFFNNGHSVSKTNEVAGDLMMLPEKKEGWVNLYKSSVRSTKEEAMKYRNKCNDYIDTIKIEWEE